MVILNESISDVDPLNVDLNYNSNMLMDVFEKERKELQEIEESEYEEPEGKVLIKFRF